MVTPKICFSVKDIHREKTRSDETPVFKEQYMNMDIWVAVTSNQLSIRGSSTETKFSKKKQSSYLAKQHSLLKVHFALPIPFVLTLASDGAVLYISKHYIFNLSTFN